MSPRAPFLLVLLLAGFAPAAVDASSIRIIDQGASAAGQASAFTAQADDPSALHYNPAGMTQLRGVQVYAGTTLIGGHTNYTGPGGNARGDFQGSVAYPPPSQIYITANLNTFVKPEWTKDWTLGIGLNFPFGTRFRWPANGPFSTAVTSASLDLLDIKPTVAYKVHEKLSLGAGLDIYTFTGLIGEGHYEQKLNSVGVIAPAGTPLEVNGKGTAVGFNLSALFTPLHWEVKHGDKTEKKPKLNFGVVYRSGARLNLNGDYIAGGARQGAASTTLNLPHIITGGIAYWPVRNAEREWKFEVDLDWTGWESVRNLDVKLPAPIGIVSNPQKWKSTYTVMVGTEHKWINPEVLREWDIALRGGYWWSESPIPNAAFNPAVPDSNNHAVSIGLGLLCKGNGRFLGLIECGTGRLVKTEGIGLDFAYKALIYEPRMVSGNANPFTLPGTADGTYRTLFHIGSVNVRINF